MSAPPPPLTYETSGRSPRALAVLVLVYSALLAGYLFLDAAPALLAAIAVFTLPALWELAVNKRAGLQLDRTLLSWFSGRREGSVPLVSIDHVAFDTRLDFSVRVTVTTSDGRKLRLPYDSLPPAAMLRAALDTREVKTEVNHFRLWS